jgi:predicted O-linked N-acetylglucosamine transferase (SPINDLY family)
MTDTPTLAAAGARAAAGDLQGADAMYAALYDQRSPDPAVMLAWSRLRRRAGDAQNAARMLEVAQRAGGGVPVLVEMAALLIDQGDGARAAQVLRRAAQSGRTVALDYEVARFEAMNRRLPQAASLFRSVTKAEPRHLEARLGLARTLASMGQADEAEGAYTALLKRDPASLPVMSELANLYGSRARYDQALALYDRMEAAGADVMRGVSQVALGMMHVCDWSARDAVIARLAARVRTGTPAVFETYALLAGADDPPLHRRMGEVFAAALRQVCETRARPAARVVGLADRRLRIGYLSGDFNQHATALLMAGVIEAHDRSAFEVFAYDYSPEDGTPMRARMKAAFEHFVVLGDQPPAACAALIAADEIDILVDLKGYTERSRSEILVLRPAPVQVQFLGYVGTQAGEWIDYVIADAVVLPKDQEANWTEAAVRMPASYYPNDRSRPAPVAHVDRAAHGLPEDGVVFACFNNPFKITPEVFAAWMEILTRTPGSVLWLYEGNPFVAANLRAHAMSAGIDAKRLVFAAPALLEEHIARHGCADLCLDTQPYGAHTTGADALWAGVPLLTCMGQSWASRVGASLLHAVGLPELITVDLGAYTDMAVALAADPQRLAALRAHLAAVRDTAPLFDAAAFARGLESAYSTMAETARQGRAPARFDVGDRLA